MRRSQRKFVLRPVSLVVLAMFGWGSAFAQSAEETAGSQNAGVLAEVEFNDEFLHHDKHRRIDVSRFNKGGTALPGSYRVDLFVNQHSVGKAEITLRQIGADVRNVQPCMTKAMLERLGVAMTKLSPESLALLQDANTCALMPDLIEGARATFDQADLRLDVSVPQVAMLRSARGYVDPQYWDDGVTAATLQYNANAYRSEQFGTAFNQAYVGLNAGFNVGAWRFRHNGSLNHNDNGTQYQSVQTNAQRSLASINSQIVLGDSFTDGALFDSVGVRGVTLSTDDRMFPESQRGYAPAIHGMANTNARVQVRQGGNVIYETTVAPGPFEVNDLYPTGYGGDLEVVVTEADGTTRVSRVPYAAAVNALRPGRLRYTATAGKYRDANVDRHPMMTQATIQYGFSNMVTGYGGIIAAENYLAAMGGAALNTSYGAFGADVTQSYSRQQNLPDLNGQSFRLSFSKMVAPTNTNIAVAAYRYSTRHYLSLADAVRLQDLHSEFELNGTPRGRLQLTLNQSLPAGYGSFYLSGSTQNYWSRTGSSTQFQLGYNNSYRRLTYGVAASRQLNLTTGKWDSSVMLNLGIPLGKSAHAPYASSRLQYDSNGAVTAQQAVTGTLGKDNAFAYGMNVDVNSGTGSSTRFGANASYASPVAGFNGSASVSSQYRQASVGMTGGVVAYGGGVVLTPTIGETMAIVEADGASGASVTSGSGLRVDPWGHAVVSSLAPFSLNQVEIDPKGLPMSVELRSTTQPTVPTAGAVVRVKFETDHAGRAAVLRVRTADGKPLPFGAQVLDTEGQHVGVVAQGGRIVVRGLKSDSGVLHVAPHGTSEPACQIPYVLPAVESGKPGKFAVVDITCE
ncbi:Outer membrane usher protein HtrE [Cupriavidus campinensis]|uniref:Fimbrial biogenesis outer membrane usher protein n=2 Tax=Burkholderiaceae TaxID=119060 RepID=A0ABY3EL84_9BURK|nr:fimbrial biogenesis outer membrane usher protein [Cupriavidus campinensis]CAG2140016.1 Outer membrane usher protein HtrE [Cupriavidus campinensis]